MHDLFGVLLKRIDRKGRLADRSLLFTVMQAIMTSVATRSRKARLPASRVMRESIKSPPRASCGMAGRF
jgi:hypothetical protein